MAAQHYLRVAEKQSSRTPKFDCACLDREELDHCAESLAQERWSERATDGCRHGLQGDYLRRSREAGCVQSNRAACSCI